MLNYPQFTIDEILAALRRRKKFFLYPLILISVTCISGAFILPQKYKSSITISVQKDAVLNPLVSYTMAVAAASDDRLKDFNEIIFSRPTLQALIDSLNLKPRVATAEGKEALIKDIMSSIETDYKGSDNFTIEFYDPVPERAKFAVKLLSELFIQKRLEVNNKRNEMAVQFFENKLVELREKFEQSQHEYVGTVKAFLNQNPRDEYGINSEIENLSSEMTIVEDKISNSQSALNILRSTNMESIDQGALENYYSVAFLNVPYAEELRTLLKQYEDLSKKYTPKFPEIRQTESKILLLVARMKATLETELAKHQNQIWKLEQDLNSAYASMRSSVVHESENTDQRSTFDVYNTLYNEMKVKLEQAKTSRDLGKKGSEQFVVINPPQLPVSPDKPNKLLLIGGGIFLGLFIGFLSAGFMELFDTRIRTNKDIEIFDKPILAYLPAPKS
ncbi:MAG: GumC family protein [Ignavibacteriales bacterium]